MDEGQVQEIVKAAVQELMVAQQAKSEPAYKAELQEERKRREQLERRMNELVAENARSRKAADEAERSSAIRAELQRLGVAKVDLAYKAVQEGVFRTEDGRLMARGDGGEVPLKDYLSSFVTENPEFLPVRISGGTGMAGTHKAAATRESVDLEKIRPGMSKEEMDRARQEILRIAAQNLGNL